mgnify:CR=1 FL=1
MIELRKDYILDRWSHIALGRGKRPQETEAGAGQAAGNACYFCPGNESMTPPEIGRLADGEGWKVRWFPNKFPAVESDLEKEIAEGGGFFTRGEAFGYHEVVAETSDHARQLADLSKEELREVLKVYAERMAYLSQKDGIKYVQIFKNDGAEGGCSIAHSHTQIIAGNLIPKNVREKTEAAKRYEKCPYCDIVAEEEKGERLIMANDNFAAFATFAPRFNYEAMIFPKKHYRNMTELSEAEFADLAEVFEKVLSKLSKAGVPYNFYLHVAPEGEDLHFHFEITPRLNTWAGYELATGAYVITTSPEEAAAFYRE